MELRREIYKNQNIFYLKDDSWPRLNLEKFRVFHAKKFYSQKNMNIHGNFSNILGISR